jgi:hypothetical protein
LTRKHGFLSNALCTDSISTSTQSFPSCAAAIATAGKAIIADGYVNLMSCSKKTVYKEGKMQAVIDYYIYDDDRRSQNGGDKPKPIKPSPDQFIAKPYQMDLILRKTGDY